MKKTVLGLIILSALVIFPPKTLAAGIGPSGGTTKTVGQAFTITVTANGTTFDSLQGTIAVSGPVSVVSFSPGSATWLPGKTPSNGAEFVGLTLPTSSLVVAKITLKGTKEGSGSVTVSGAKLARSGSVVGSDGGSTQFKIQKAPNLPGEIKVSSSSHPDPNQSYEATTIQLSWEKPSGVTAFAYLLDQTSDTTPPATKTSADATATYADKAVGTYYFHIRAQNGDGWGGATHFKITIKEPDAKVNEALTKTSILGIEKAPDFKTNLDDGTITGIVLHGKSEPKYKVTATFTPPLPDGTAVLADADDQGNWTLPIATAIKSGFYTVTAQGQLDKVLTPASLPVKFEITLAAGGSVHILTDKDTVSAALAQAKTNAKSTTATRALGYVARPWFWLTVVLLVGLSWGGVHVYRRKQSESP